MNTYLNFGNAKCFDFVRECLNACVVDHDCGCDDPPQLPTRLLDVDTSDPKRICLVATADLLAAGENVEKYTPLSYCWGPVDAFTTTPALLAERMEGIAVADMPDTLRDAVFVTRKLGCRYLWIDALCILQGDADEARDDWRAESARMQSVYGQAFCTIVAAWSRDCYGGLFHTTQPSDSGRLSSGRSLELFKDQPINSRAWALQEWLLSPRLLVYSHNDLLFFCGRTMLSKNQLDYSAAWHMHPIYKYRLPRYPAQPALDQWFNMVQNYSARDLTDPEDKLPAIAGLARRFHDLTGTSSGQYLAGMWREDLFASLLWRRQDAWGAFLAIPDHSVLEWYRAPSWSWAAGDGLVCDMIVRQGRKTKSEDRAVRIIDCRTEPATGDPFGAVISGQLIVTGPSRAFRATLDGDTLISRLTGFPISVAVCSLDSREDDAVRDRISATSTHLLIFLTYTDDTEATVQLPMFGLILVPSQFDVRIYTRVGFFTALVSSPRCQEWWSEAQTREYTII